MTPSTKPVSRLTSAYARDKGLRQIVATIHGSILELRCKGLRSREALDITHLYEYAVKGRVARERFEKRASRRNRR